MNGSASVNVMAKAAEAAQKAGAAYPEAVAEFIKDKLTIAESVVGPQVVVQNGLEVEPLDAAMARLKATEKVGVLFHGGKLNTHNLDHELYLAIRAHAPELVGLRPNKNGRR